MRYGIPYQGSKNKIAEWVVSNLPEGETLVDLFAGGCAVTHAALLSGKWDRIIANDIGDGPQVFDNAIEGRYADEKRWISREEFYRLKDTDPYVSLCWSYGNDRTNYLYSRESEPIKKALHYARVLGDDSLLDRLPEEPKEKERLQSAERLQGLNDLQRLQILSKFPSSPHFEQLRQDYREVEIPANAIVYADPPYKGTSWTGYRLAFDYPAFEKWLADVPYMVVVSERSAPLDCVEVARIKKADLRTAKKRRKMASECLYVQKRFLNRWEEKCPISFYNGFGG